MNNPASQQSPKATLPASFVMVLMFCFFGLVSGCVYDQVKPKVYESHSEFQIRIGSKLANDNVELGELIDCKNDLMISESAVVDKAIADDQLGALESFKEIQEIDLPDYVMANLELEQNGDEPSIFRVSYRDANPADTQVVLNSFLSSYEKTLARQINEAIANQIVALKDLLRIANESLTEEVAKGASAGVASRLEARIVDIHSQVQSSESFYSDIPDFSKVTKFMLLRPPMHGEPVGPRSLHCILIGSVVGLLFGLVCSTVLGLIGA